MEKRFENFTFLIMRASKLIQRIKNFEIKEFGLKAVHVMCIFYLNENPQGLTGSELVKLTQEDKAAVSRALALMEERGYIYAEKKERLGRIFLSQEGKSVARYINDAAQKAVEAGGGCLSEEERGNFYKSLQKITENLNDYYKQLQE